MKKKFNERVDAQVVLEEREDGKPRRLKIEGAITAGVVNGNKRRYPAEVVRLAVEELRNHLNESAGQGRAIQILGEAEHPSDKGGRPNLLETVTKWDEVAFDGTRVDLTGRIMETSKGKDILTLMEGGVMPGVSLRGYGEGKYVKEEGRRAKDEEKIFEVTELHITGFDLVLEPSFENAAQLIESINSQGDFEMNELLENLKKLLVENPELFNKGMTEAQLEAMNDKQLKKLEESLRSALGIDANANIIESVKANADKAKKYDELQAKQDIEAAITEATKELPYGETLNAMFTESLREAEFASAEAVKKFAESQKKQYAKMAAKGVLKGMGFDEKKNSVLVIGDVLERETGTPEFARGAFELVEAIRKLENRGKRTIDLRAESPAEIFTRQLLENFDRQYSRHLLAESKNFQEAETTSDLFLPYTVSRAMIEEAFPNLVGANIFDVGVMLAALMSLPFEHTVGETGYTDSVSDEVVTGGAEGVWYDLDHGFIDFDSEVVTSNPAGTTYINGTDYVMDYAGGRIKFLPAGSIGSNDVLVDYDYTAIREGEMAAIQRVKSTIDHIDIKATAVRLADQISREAMVYGLSQLGWDAIARTMQNLIKQLRRKIDNGLLYMAISGVRSVPSNSTDPWTVGTAQEDLDELVRLLGGAGLLVTNRYYDATFNLMSATRAEALSHWEGFARTGFPNALLNAAGFAGVVNNKPIFASTEFPDSLAIAGNRELVQHRVFQPLIVKGPYPTYDEDGKLIAADQYYAEEFNTSVSPVPEKGAFVPIEEAGS